jgi:hypothetical protein
MKTKHIVLIAFVFSISIGLVLLSKTFGSIGEDQSLLGMDSNHDGIRDDIEKYIQDRFPNSEKRRAALLQLASAWQSVFSVYDRPEQIKTEYLKVVNSNYCVLGVFNKEGGDAGRDLMAEFFNNQKRSEAFIHTETMMREVYNDLVPHSQFKERCQFDLSSMKN